MKSLLSQLLLICLTSFTLFGQDWNTIQDYPSGTINSLLYVNDSTAYAVSSLYNGTALNVKKTTDDGVTWTEQYTGQTSMNFRKIATPNNGGDLFIIGNAGVLVHTNDGGANWNLATIPTTENLRDIFFLSSTIGFICADNAAILKTVDGGMTWINMNPTLPGISTVANIHFLTESRGFIAGFNYFRETSDGGVTWTDVIGFENLAGTLYQIQDIFFLNDSVGYISGDQALLFKTTDGGTTWVDMEVIIPGITFTIESIFSVNFLDAHPAIGFACGYHGLLIRTFDGGVNWELMSSDIAGTNTDFGSNFHDLEFWGNKGLLSGHNGEILEFEYIDPFASISEFNQGTNSMKLFPNPVNDILTIATTDEEIEQISIYDYSGKMCKVIDHPISETIDCSDLQNGYYILTIHSKGSTLSKPFIKN